MKNIFTYDNFAYEEAVAFFEYFKQQSCVYSSCLELGNAPQPRGVSFRYDIHVRDISGAYGFLAAHYHYDIPGTFFLLPDYSSDERAALADFLALARRIHAPVEIGLHDSPVDSYLINHKFNGIGIEYWRWLQSDQSLAWFTKLAESERECEAFHAQVMDAFHARVTTMKKQFGDFNTMASHGGEINQMFRKRLPELGITGEFLGSLFAESWITEERLAQVGLSADVEQFRKKAPLIYQVTDGGGLIQRMVDNAGKFLVERNRAVQILIHPYTWAGPLSYSGGVRDGEVSVLLGVKEDKGPMGGRKGWQRLLRTRIFFMAASKRSVRDETPDPGVPKGVEKRTIVCATVDDVAADARRARLSRSQVNALVIEADSNVSLGHSGVPALTPFLEYLASSDGVKRIPDVVLGRSLDRYGPLITGAIDCIVNTEMDRQGQELSAQCALAQWILEMLKTDPRQLPAGMPRLDKKELWYFLFSSSQRSHVVKRIVDHFFAEEEISCLVDHGAGIGIIPLCTKFACNHKITKVICSEIKHDFVSLGTSLWKALGYESVIHYQECSATEFVYADEASIVLFAQMLYRIEPQKRLHLLASAWAALKPGGLLVINELMDRDAGSISTPLLKSDELLGYLPSKDGWLFWGRSDAKSVCRLQEADRKLFHHADNFIVIQK